MGRLDGRLVCANCCGELATIATGVKVRFGNHGVYYADIKGCPERLCGGTRVITNWAENPLGENEKPEYVVR